MVVITNRTCEKGKPRVSRSLRLVYLGSFTALPCSLRLIVGETEGGCAGVRVWLYIRTHVEFSLVWNC